MLTVKVSNMISSNGNEVANQFRINTSEGQYFQSYNSIIALRPICGGKIQLDIGTWDYSVTTGKYRNIFLGETKRETEVKIKSGEYILTDLN